MIENLNIAYLLECENATIQQELESPDTEIVEKFSTTLNNVLNQKEPAITTNVDKVKDENKNVSHISNDSKSPSIMENSKVLSKVTESSSTKYSSIIEEMSQKYNVPESLINKVIEAESSFNPNVTSSAGAQGLMQLMPQTAKHLGVTNPFDPRENIEGGVKYLKQMVDQFGNWRLALAAYNAGPGNVRKYGGIPPFEETQNYVKKILGA